MKKKIIAIILCLISVLISNLKGQHITGEWNGVLDAMGTQVALVFDIQKSDSGYTTTLDSPDQGAIQTLMQKSFRKSSTVSRGVHQD